MQIFEPFDIDAHRVGRAGILTHSTQLQAGDAVIQIPPHSHGNGNTQVYQNIMGEQTTAQKGDFGQAGNCNIGKSVFNVGIIRHNRPAPGFQTVSYEEVNAQSEGCQGKAGNILVCL